MATTRSDVHIVEPVWDYIKTGKHMKQPESWTITKNYLEKSVSNYFQLKRRCSTNYSKFNQTSSLEGPHWQQSRITCTFLLKLFLEIFPFADVKSTLLFQTAIRLNHHGG